MIKETFESDTDTMQAPHEHYAKHIQVGNKNMMLICEPKEMEPKRKYYKQVGDKNIMVNLTHSSMFYQLLMLAKEFEQEQVFPLTSDGEGIHNTVIYLIILNTGSYK